MSTANPAGMDAVSTVSNFAIESDAPALQKDPEHHTATAHKIDHDPWYQVGILLATSFNCGYIVSFSNLVMKPLGWVWGTIGLAVFGVFSLYANCLLANLHVIDGRRFIRYRDLMDYAFGRKLYYATWILQFATFVLGNMGFILLAGRALKATLRQPYIKNMYKALYFQFSVGLSIYYTITIIGYWAYGSLVSEYLFNELHGPKWAKVLANATMFLQTIISQHMFCAPIHETLDTKFSRLHEHQYSIHNILTRFFLRALFFMINTFVAAMFPFLGDFVNLVGSLSLIPLTFVFPSLLFLKVKGKISGLLNRIWHWLNVIIFSFLTIATTSSSIYFIIKNSQSYRLFANT